ncbi:hypothetical protein WR164_14510 [Philodulcilactobacillus myokoensis]|uniref:Uncharacterized protein n=1 Tax=Philodulcilactobacillus myokoensis TaxID=2929573 RepID=A0A9W6B253_9LACO|nr:hypothetical protein [Philodulcilactobacillus myokoensis]GLB47472.1 hypothetical protein WR164_14510 [Philodulcilactobacillus myokoensis]
MKTVNIGKYTLNFPKNVIPYYNKDLNQIVIVSHELEVLYAIIKLENNHINFNICYGINIIKNGNNHYTFSLQI